MILYLKTVIIATKTNWHNSRNFKSSFRNFVVVWDRLLASTKVFPKERKGLPVPSLRKLQYCTTKVVVGGKGMWRKSVWVSQYIAAAQTTKLSVRRSINDLRCLKLGSCYFCWFVSIGPNFQSAEVTKRSSPKTDQKLQLTILVNTLELQACCKQDGTISSFDSRHS